MKTRREIESAIRLLARVAADEKRRPGDRSVATGTAIALGWVLGEPLASEGLGELLAWWGKDYQ